MSGVAEEAAEFRREDAFTGLARFRRFAESAPLFEVLEVVGERVKINFVETNELGDVRLSDVQHSIQAV